MPPRTVVRRSLLANKIGAKMAQSANPRAAVSKRLNLNQVLKKRQNLVTPQAELTQENLGVKRLICSTFSAGDYGQIEELPSLKDIPENSFNEYFKKMLQQCMIKCNFGDELLDIKNKQTKTKYLNEILKTLSTPEFYKIADASSIKELFKMIKSNILRYTPPIPALAKVPMMGDDIVDTIYEASWPHLELIYQIFTKFLESPLMDAKSCADNINETFIHRFVLLFNSPDARERNELKLVLHRIYLRFVQHRPTIRATIQNVFYTFLFEEKFFCGINELLEIMVSIINGYSVPLKKEHLLFFDTILIPLHSSDMYYLFSDNLTMCIAQFLAKDQDLVVRFFMGLIKLWPVTSTVKELMFIEQIDHLIEIMSDEQFDEIKPVLFDKIAELFISNSFRVSEAAMLLWKNDRFIELTFNVSKEILPIIAPPLYQAGMAHWNLAIRNLAVSVIRICMDSIEQEDQANFNKTVKMNDELAARKLKMKKDTWMAIENQAIANGYVNPQM